MSKRMITPRQARNLAMGREKLFQNQLRQKGINPNPQPQIIREVRQPVNNYTSLHQHNLNVKVSLFNELIGTKFFPVEINKNKEILNLKELINHIFARLDFHWQNISSNKSKTDEIISHINYKDQENDEKLRNIEKKISHLEEENLKLKEQLNLKQK